LTVTAALCTTNHTDTEVQLTTDEAAMTSKPRTKSNQQSKPNGRIVLIRDGQLLPVATMPQPVQFQAR
jgi:hypothetical protein